MISTIGLKKSGMSAECQNRTLFFKCLKRQALMDSRLFLILLLKLLRQSRQLSLLHLSIFSPALVVSGSVCKGSAVVVFFPVSGILMHRKPIIPGSVKHHMATFGN